MRRRLARLWARAPERVDLTRGYALWAPVYPARPHNPLMQAESETVGSLIRMLRPRRALDVGTGTGRNLALLRSLGAELVVGLDLSAAMIGQASGAACCIRADARRLPFACGTFDLVTSSLMAGDVAEPGAWLDEAARVLRPGGHLVYSDFHPSWSSRGWTRSFAGEDGRSYELPFEPHSEADHRAALRRCALDVRAAIEPRAGLSNVPVLLVIHAVKCGSGT